METSHMHEDVLNVEVKNDLALAKRLHAERAELHVQVQVVDATFSAELCQEALSHRVLLEAVLVDVRRRLKPETAKIGVDFLGGDAIDSLGS